RRGRPPVIPHGRAWNACAPSNSSGGLLGPGPWANASIGRALRLVLLNVGGGSSGVGDMSSLGQPAKFSFCMAEAEEESPFAALHTTHGFATHASAVTVVGVEGPH